MTGDCGDFNVFRHVLWELPEMITEMHTSEICGSHYAG